MEYTFTLKYRLAADDNQHEQLIERLAKAGCDDATVGIGQAGRIGLIFTREDTSAAAALISALADVKRAIPTATLVEAGPDLVGLTDVADVAGVSRQNMRKLMLSHVNDFPMPVHEGSASLWHLSDVLGWLNLRPGYAIAADVLDVAHWAKQVNLVRGQREQDPKAQAQLRGLIT